MNRIEIPFLTDGLFRKFTALLFQKSGITLKDYKKYLVINRLSKLVGRGREFTGFEEYYEALKNDKDGRLTAAFVNALTTNYSFFFRDKVHFEFLKQYLLEKRRSETYIRLWSSACSTGEEPYSMAIICYQILQDILSLDIKILATDVSTKALETAKKGLYNYSAVDGHVNNGELKTYFDYDRKDNQFQIRQILKELIAFRYLNLFESYPFKKLFDMVFLRNVLIYFNNREKEMVVQKVSNFIKPGGYLILGLSETIFEIKHDLFALKNSIYQKK